MPNTPSTRRAAVRALHGRAVANLRANLATAYADEDRASVLDAFYALNDARLDGPHVPGLFAGWQADADRYHAFMLAGPRALVTATHDEDTDPEDRVTGAEWTYTDCTPEPDDGCTAAMLAAHYVHAAGCYEADVCPITRETPPRWFTDHDTTSVHFAGPWTDEERVSVARMARIYGA